DIRIRTIEGGTSADQNVIDAVAIDIAGRADRTTRVVKGVDAIQDEARAAIADVRRQQARQLEPGREITSHPFPPEYNVTLPGSASTARSGMVRTDQQVIDAVAVNVAGRADGTTRVVEN